MKPRWPSPITPTNPLRRDISAKIYDRALITVDPRQTQTARNAAEANLEMARAAWMKTKLEGELAVATARRDAAAAKETFGLAEAAVKSAELEGQAAISTAEIALQSAKHQVKVVEQLLELARASRRIDGTRWSGSTACRGQRPGACPI